MRELQLALTNESLLNEIDKFNQVSDLERSSLDQNLELDNEVKEGQKNFFESTVGKAVNFGLDIGLKAILPDMIEDVVIDIKDTLVSNGLKEGVHKIAESCMDFGKSILGLTTGKFDNINQIDMAVKQGGIIDNISKFLNIGIDKAVGKGAFSQEIGSVIKAR